MVDAAALLAAFPLTRATWPHWARGGVLWEEAAAPSYSGELVLRSTYPAGRALELRQGGQGWAVAASTDEQVGIHAWLRHRAPDAFAAIGSVWFSAYGRFAEAEELDRERNRLFVTYLRQDGYAFARIEDRDGRVVVFTPHGTTTQVLTFWAQDVLDDTGGVRRWREDAGLLHVIAAPASLTGLPPLPPAPPPWVGGPSFSAHTGGSPGPAVSARHPFLGTPTAPMKSIA